ncbi:DNA-binding domain-containing protein [Marinicauda algicola]|nr:DNA-binding domain-containing protein [Marinicauda algicola]
MSRSAEFPGALRRALQGDLEAAAAYLDRSEDRDRYAVYANNRAVALADTLSRAFPAVLTLVGRRFFRAVAIEFANTHPPENPVLALYGARFADFLAGFPPLARLAYVADVARLDRAWSEAHFASDAGLYDPAPAPDEPLVLSPRARLLTLSWPVHDLWQASRQKLAPPSDQLEPNAQHALVWRGAEGMESEILTPAEFEALARPPCGAPAGTAILFPFITRGALIAQGRTGPETVR